MSQIPLFRDSAPPVPKAKTVPNSKPNLNSHPKQSTPKQSRSKQLASRVAHKIETQPEAIPTLSLDSWGTCRVCGTPIAIPGLDASFCSNPARTCGSGGWVVEPKWLDANPPRSGKGGAA